MNLSSIKTHLRQAVRFDRNELSGAFGDIGTDFPLIVGMILVGGLHAPSVLILFGLMQIFAGLVYGIPMPAQPLKIMAILVIAGEGRINAAVLYGAGLSIGVAMLVLSVTGLIDVLAKAIPKCVIRGIQFGLGLKLAHMALGYVQGKGLPGHASASGVPEYVLAGVAFALTLFLIGNRRFPPAPFVILIGIAYALLFEIHAGWFGHSIGFNLPHIRVPSFKEIKIGFLDLALAQIALSLGNSILATRQVSTDLFPEKAPSVRKIGFTYSLMNLVNPFFGGIPTCHGSGGMVGHHAFGGRTGGSVLIYGSFYLILGLFFSSGFHEIIKFFPLPILGVILLFEGFFLMRLIRDMVDTKGMFAIALLVGLIAFGLPKGHLVGLFVGTVLAYLAKRNWIGFAK